MRLKIAVPMLLCSLSWGLLLNRSLTAQWITGTILGTGKTLAVSPSLAPASLSPRPRLAPNALL